MLEGTSLYDAYSFSNYDKIEVPVNKKEKKKESHTKIEENLNNDRKIQYSNSPIFNEKPVIIYKQEDSYLTKLFSKKRDLLKIIQLSLIITLGLSIYHFISHYVDLYINTNDLSSERQFVIRLLFPISIIILIWNMRLIKFY